MNKFKISIKLFLVIICMLIIFMLSSDNSVVSTKKSDSIIINTVEFFKGDSLSKKQKDNYIEYFVLPVRKGAHFTIYFILGFLVINLLYEFDLNTRKKIVFSIIMCFLYACSDEIHQLFVNGRSGQIMDVFIDTMGSSVSIILFNYIFNKFKIKNKI